MHRPATTTIDTKQYPKQGFWGSFIRFITQEKRKSELDDTWGEDWVHYSTLNWAASTLLQQFGAFTIARKRVYPTDPLFLYSFSSLQTTHPTHTHTDINTTWLQLPTWFDCSSVQFVCYTRIDQFSFTPFLSLSLSFYLSCLNSRPSGVQHPRSYISARNRHTYYLATCIEFCAFKSVTRSVKHRQPSSFKPIWIPKSFLLHFDWCNLINIHGLP